MMIREDEDARLLQLRKEEILKRRRLDLSPMHATTVSPRYKTNRLVKFQEDPIVDPGNSPKRDL
jgi:hypothetical protein